MHILCIDDRHDIPCRYHECSECHSYCDPQEVISSSEIELSYTKLLSALAKAHGVKRSVVSEIFRRGHANGALKLKRKHKLK